MSEVIVGKVCIKCGIAKRLNEFYTDPGKRDGVNSTCKACKKALMKRPEQRARCRELRKNAYAANVANGTCGFCGVVPEDGKKLCVACRAKNQTRKKANKEKWRILGLCLHCGRPREQGSVLCKRCRAYNRAKGMELRRQWRDTLLEAYGGKCTCCGESNKRFLTIDHTKGNGAKERKILRNGVLLFRSLRDRGYPKDDYTCLCMNCNWGRYHNGGICPHVSERGQLF